MFEQYTYENLLDRVLSRVSNDIDKRQGSVIFDAVAPCCVELAQMYVSLENVLNASFADTAPREQLILRAKERGMTPYVATHAIVKGEFSTSVPIGARFNIDKLNFIVEEKIGDYIYRLKCENAGEEGNKCIGDIIAIEYIEGLQWARITEVLVYGEDEEATEAFRKRYFDNINKRAFCGNKADYINWVKAVDGVGGTKVERAYNGGGTVKVIVTNINGKPASKLLLDNIKQRLDPLNFEGLGKGIAPIGHKVLVETANEVSLNVKLKLSLKAGYSLTDINNGIKECVEKSFDNYNNNWENSDNVFYAASVIVEVLKVSGIQNIEYCKVDSIDFIALRDNDLVKLGKLEVIV